MKKIYNNNNKTKGNKIKKITIFMALYSAIFTVLALTLSGIFASESKSFIWSIDGAGQHLVAMKYIRNAIITFFTTGKFAMVDYSLGQGLDVIGTLNYYGFGDPTSIFTVLFPANQPELMYKGIIFIRMYLSGIAVAYLCKTLGKTRIYSVLPASLLYAFCPFALIGGIKHPLFFCGIMYLPLIIAAVEKVIRDKKVVTLAIVVAFAFASNYYFMYMNTVLAAIYFFIRQAGIYKESGVKKVFIRIGKIIVGYLWGMAMAAVILFPSVYAFLNNARTDADLALPPTFFTPEYYEALYKGIVSSASIGHSWAIPGIGMLGAFALSVVIVHWKKSDRRLIAGFVILLAMLNFQIVGKIMNGFSYSTMRFSYGMALLLVIMLVYALEELKDVSKISVFVVLGILLAVYISFFWIAKIGSDTPKLDTQSAILGIITIVIVVAYIILRNKKWSGIVLYGVTIIAAVNAAFNFETIVSHEQLYNCLDYVGSGGINTYMSKGGTPSIQKLQKQDKSFYRVEKERDMLNKSTYWGYNQATFYWSIVPTGMTDLYVSACMGNHYKTFVVSGLEDRIGLMALAGIKYYVNQEDKAPYGYYKIGEDETRFGTNYVYKNALYLPLGITYSSCMTKEQYDKLNPVQREQALLENAVVDKQIDGIATNNTVENIEKIPITVEKRERVKVGKNIKKGQKQKGKKKIRITDTGENKIIAKRRGKMWLNFQGKENCQTYIIFENMHVKDLNPDKRMAAFKGKHIRGSMRVSGNQWGYYYKKDATILNLGYSKEAQNKFKLRFRSRRKYEFDNAYAVCVPIGNYVNAVNKLKENTLENIKMDTNLITGKIKADKDEILQLSVPYADGYKVYVDGKETNTFKSSVAYLGVKISKGTHNIRVEYTTPFIKLGFVTSIGGVLILLAYVLRDLAKKRMKETIGENPKSKKK